MSEGSKFKARSKASALGSLTSAGDQLGAEPEDEELALGGFRPASDVLNEAEEQDIGTDATVAMSKSDPPPDVAAAVSGSDPAQTATGSFEVPVADDATGADEARESGSRGAETPHRDASQEEAQDAPAVTPEDLHAADVDLGAASFFRPRDEQAPPPFEATRLTDPGSVPPAAPIADDSTDDRHPPRTPRPPNRRIEVQIVTPETIERREKLETWKRWGCALLVLCFLAIIAAVVVVVGMSAVSWATERGWIGDEVVETERETVRPPTRVTVADPETEPPVTPVAPLEEARPVRPVMPPPVIEPPPVVRPTTVPEPDEPSRRPVCRRIEGTPGRLLYRCE